ncbi:hypothetical protein WKW80_30360 [Variovorax humicola]|uniref:DUF3304 domain-containing protein n=1 Tax=Variovorax humicola TaxID=1769758 RepID=A0ABU8W8A2_9BURK
MPRMKSAGILLAAVAGAMLCACTYSEINPDAAREDIRTNNGYYDLREIEPGTARIVVRAAGTGYPAHFSVSTSAQNCQAFTSLGDVAYAGRGLVYPWIANATQRGRRSNPYLVHEAKPSEPIQVRGYGSWADGKDSGYRSGNCGPVTARFTPEAGHGYTVDFAWGDKPACRLVVMDATNPDAPVPVSAQVIAGCPAPSRR